MVLGGLSFLGFARVASPLGPIEPRRSFAIDTRVSKAKNLWSPYALIFPVRPSYASSACTTRAVCPGEADRLWFIFRTGNG